MSVSIYKSNTVLKYEYVVLAFDMMLALLGGFTAFLYDGGEVILEKY